MAAAKVNLNDVPYNAPLSFKGPEKSWIRKQTHKGSSSKTLSVPAANLTGKWIIISGSNNGIGREAALQFAAWGANLILACRNPPPTEAHPEDVVLECLAKAREAGHKTTEIEWWELDCAKLSSVEAFCKRWLATERPLDILCNNAGIGSSPGDETIFKTADGFEIIHQVNLLSHILTTLTLLPSLARASKPRVVCTTSCFHYPGIFDMDDFGSEKGRTGPGGVQLYMNNKLYFQTWLTELQHRMLQHDEYKHIVINGVHPGYVNTGVWNLNMTDMTVGIKQAIVKTLAFFMAITPQQGSLTILHGATSADAGRAGGRYFSRTTEEAPMPHCHDRDCRLRVWRKVNDELKLQDRGLLEVLGLRAEDV